MFHVFPWICSCSLGGAALKLIRVGVGEKKITMENYIVQSEIMQSLCKKRKGGKNDLCPPPWLECALRQISRS